MTVLHTGSTKAYASGWEGIFRKSSSKQAKPAAAPKRAKSQPAAAKSPKKKPATKRPAAKAAKGKKK